MVIEIGRADARLAVDPGIGGQTFAAGALDRVAASARTKVDPHCR